MRPSTEVAIENGFLRIINLIVGLVLMAGGAFGAYTTLEKADAGHVDHPLIYLCAGIALFGALMLPGIFTAVKPILIFIVPYIPWVGGRRRDDPPA